MLAHGRNVAIAVAVALMVMLTMAPCGARGQEVFDFVPDSFRLGGVTRLEFEQSLPDHVYTVCSFVRDNYAAYEYTFSITVSLHAANSNPNFNMWIDIYPCQTVNVEPDPALPVDTGYTVTCVGISYSAYTAYAYGTIMTNKYHTETDNLGPVIQVSAEDTGGAVEMDEYAVPLLEPTFSINFVTENDQNGGARINLAVDDGGYLLAWELSCYYPVVGKVPGLIDVEGANAGELSFWTWESHSDDVRFAVLRTDGWFREPPMIFPRLTEAPLKIDLICQDLQSIDFTFNNEPITQLRDRIQNGEAPCFPYTLNQNPDPEDYFLAMNQKMYFGMSGIELEYTSSGYVGPFALRDRFAYMQQMDSSPCCRRCGSDVCPPQYYPHPVTGCCELVSNYLQPSEDGLPFSCPAGKYVHLGEVNPERVVADLGYDPVNSQPRVCIDCPEGGFTPSDNLYSRCLACPARSICTNGTVLAGLLSAPSYCEYPDTSVITDFGDDYLFSFNDTVLADPPTVVRRCPWDHACLSGNGQCGACQKGYTGALCGNCAAGYFKFEAECEECPENPSIITILIGLVILAVIVFIGLGAARNPAMANPLISTGLISTSHLQVLAVYLSFDITWPPRVLEFMRRFSVFSFNIDMVVMGPSCVTDEGSGIDFNDPRTKVAFYGVVIPLGMVLFVVIMRLMACCCKGGACRNIVSFEYRFFILFFSFSYIFLAARTLESFDCEALISGDVVFNGTAVAAGGSDEDDQTRVLGAYPSVECNLEDNEYQTIFLLGLFGFLVWVVVVPLVMFCVVWRKRKRLQDEDVMKKYGPLFSKYKDHAYLFEFVHLAKKLFLAAVAILVLKRSATQLVVSLVGLAAFNLYFLWQRPYTETALNVLYAILGIVEFLVLLGGFAFRHIDRTDNIKDLFSGSGSEHPFDATTGLGAALDIMILILMVVALLVILAVVVYLIWRRIQRFRDGKDEDGKDLDEIPLENGDGDGDGDGGDVDIGDVSTDGGDVETGDGPSVTTSTTMSATTSTLATSSSATVSSTT